MAKTKTKNTPPPRPSDDTTDNGIKNWILLAFMLLISPFYFPAAIINGDLKKAGLGVGYYVIPGVIMSIIYVLIVRKFAKKYPKSSVIKWALGIWVVGIAISLIVRQVQDNQKEGEKTTKGSGQLA